MGLDSWAVGMVVVSLPWKALALFLGPLAPRFIGEPKMPRSVVFEEKLKQENARLRMLIRHLARFCPMNISKPVLEELDGLPKHRPQEAAE